MRAPAPVVAALLAACAASDVPRPALTSFAALSADEFPGAAALLDGFDERTDDRAWLAHDRVLYGLRLDGDEGDVVRWLLLVELPLGQRVVGHAADGGPRPIQVGATGTWRFSIEDEGGTREIRIDSQLVNARARVFTADGELLTDTEDSLPVDLLGRGLVAAVERARGANEPPPLDRTTLEGLLAVQRLLEIVRSNDALSDYFWQVVEKPSLWSVLTSFGVRVGVDLPLEQSVPVPSPGSIPAADPTYAVPLRIDVNGSPALFVDMIAADARRPYAVCGGIVAAIARHPSRPERTFRMQLLAARLGREPNVTIRPSGR